MKLLYFPNYKPIGLFPKKSKAKMPLSENKPVVYSEIAGAYSDSVHRNVEFRREAKFDGIVGVMGFAEDCF